MAAVDPSVPESVTRRRGWAWLGLAAGLGLGLADFGVMWAMGVRITLGETDLFAAVFCLFGLTYAALGFFLGRLLETRAALRAERRVIEQQVRDLERARDREEQARDREEEARAAAEAERERAREYEKLAGIGRLAAGVAHDVRNPLAVIRSSADLLFESIERPDENAERSREFVRAEVDRLDAYIGRLLQFARPVQAERGEIDVPATVERVLRVVSEQAAAGGIETAARVELERAVGDADLLEQVLTALAVNAVQAVSEVDGGSDRTSEEGRVDVRVRREGGDLVAEVADDGPGLSPEATERMFEPFFTDKAKGTGLGLAMARKLTEAMGGELSAVDQAGLGPGRRGARFRLRLPGAANTEERPA